MERLSNALCKMSGSCGGEKKTHKGRRKGRIKVQNASLSLASTLLTSHQTVCLVSELRGTKKSCIES